MLESKINNRYDQHDHSRICQGDICRDFKFEIVSTTNEVIEVYLPYVVVISQDCDLEQGLKLDYIPSVNPEEHISEFQKFNQLLPNILFVAAFPAIKAREGNHLEALYKITQDRINSDKWRDVMQNLNERYHFLESHPDLQVPELLVDFKLYYSLPTSTFWEKYPTSYFATINELYREKLSQRFAYYLNRIAVPEAEGMG